MADAKARDIIRMPRNILLVLYVEDLAQLDATLVEVEDGNKFLFSSHKGVSWAKVKYIYE